ncbi:MAG: alpha-2-macroglobulin [Burkholderiaceae bacterium]|nr:MAG: alpha-2-macroglobulin [Burkholderiaceae bacterium]
MLIVFLSPTVSGAAQIAQFSPQGRVAVVESVKAVFDVPVIPAGDDQAAAPMLVHCDDPDVRGQGRWVDARHWTYVFTERPGPGVQCRASVDSAFRTLSGEPLRGTAQFAFSTGGPHVVFTRPYGPEVDEAQIFVLRFNGKVDPASVASHVTCQAEGLGEEIPVRLIDAAAQRTSILDATNIPDAQRNASVQLVQCKRRLPADAKLQLVVGAGVATPSGVATDKAQIFEYTVRQPFAASFSCLRENANAPCTPVSPITLEFSAPVPSELAAKIRLKTPSVDLSPTMDKNSTYRGTVDRVRFPGPFPAQATMLLELPQGMKDDAGRALSNADQFPLSVPTAPFPPLVKFAAAPFGVIERFAYSPAAMGGDGDTPSVPLSVRNVEASLRAKEFAVSAGTVRDHVTQDDVEVLHWYARLMRLEQGSWTDAQLQRIMRDQAPRSDKGAPVDERGFSALASQKNVRELTLPALDKVDPRPLEVIGVPVEEPGYHVLEIESARLGASLLESRKPMYVRSSALVTNLGVHLKRGRDDALVWVTTLDGGRVVPNASVNVLDCDGNTLATGKTDAQGLWHHMKALNAPEHCDSTGLSGVYVSARIPASHPLAHGKADFSFVLSGWDRGIESWRFNVPTDTEPTPSLISHTVFDRTLLRAGETVSMKHYIRSQTRDGLALPDDAGLPRTLVIEHQGSGERVEQPLTWRKTASGGLDAVSQFKVPKTAKLGVYTVTLKGKKGYTPPDGQFQIEQFKLPVLSGSLKISAAQDSAWLVAPESLNADVQISYVSGGSAARLPISLSGVARDKWVSFDGYDDYSFNAPDPEDGDSDISEQRDVGTRSVFLDKMPATLDAQGGARVAVNSLPATNERARELLFEATFADPNGEIQTLSQTATVWPSSVVAGIRSGSWVEQGQDVVVTGLSLSPSGKPQAGVQMSVRAISRTTYSTRKRLVGGFYSYDSHTEMHDLGVVCHGTTDAQGMLPCHANVKQSGSIELVATARDAKGRESRATSTVWVVGADELWFGGANDDRMDLIPEKKEYAPGETAVFQVRMPFREATALVTIEREGVLATRVVDLKGNDPRVRIPIEPQWGPNVYVSVLALRGRLHEVPWYSFFTWGWKQPGAWLQAYGGARGKYSAPTGLIDLSKPAFRLGLTEIRVADGRDKLVVKVSADKGRYQVRGKADVTIQVLLPDGRPAANGEVAFAAVDEALLALAPNTSWALLDAMRQRRSYGVQTATAQMQIVGRRHYGRKAVAAGGGGGTSPTRELLDTLLLWKPVVRLNEQGMARLTVPLNDSITSFRLVAIADYGAQDFGTGSATIAVSQDLQVISGLPALVREGDRYQASLSVRNTTRREMYVEVGASYSGVGLPAESLAARQVTVSAGMARTVSWPVQVPESNSPDGTSALEWILQAHELGGDPVRTAAIPAATVDQARNTSVGVLAATAITTGILAADRVAVRQKLLPGVPISVRQSTLEGVEQGRPIRLAVQAPEGSQKAAQGRPRGGLEIYLQSTLGGTLPGVSQWFSAYPYTCLEQLGSRAIGMRSTEQWAKIVAQLPDYLDRDGLAGYFPGASHGSEVLTAYLLVVSDEAQSLGWPFSIPQQIRTKMMQGLLAFATGKIVRNRWAPKNDLDVRKLLVLEALSREGLVNARMLDSIVIAPNRWPTSAVIDWMTLLQRVPSIPDSAASKAQAVQILRARLSSRGTSLVLADDAQDNWWWLMSGPQVNVARLMLAVMDEPGWADDIPRLAQGLMASQVNGAWRTTTANLLASLAMERFSRRYERAPVSGKTSLSLTPGGAIQTYQWPATGVVEHQAVKSARIGDMLTIKAPVPVARYFEPWAGSAPQTLVVEHQGSGRGWVTVRSLAAVPLVKPVMAGYDLQRQVVPVTQAVPGQWSRGDVYRVKLRITAQTPTTWAVLNDPIPAGAIIMGGGLGRDSAIAAMAQKEDRDGSYDRPPSFIERTFDSMRAYYDYLPQGVTTIEYTVRLNTAGQFQLPPTRIEALYQPDVYGAWPNTAGMAVHAAASDPGSAEAALKSGEGG